MGFVPIIMGSRKDLEHAQKIVDGLKEFGIDSEVRIASAHKATEYLMGLLKEYESDTRPKVYITVAGRSNALSGVVDSQVTAPVVACPPYSDRFGGADLYSSLRMPSGVAAAVVLEPKAAALFAAKMLSLVDAELRQRIDQAHMQIKAGIEKDDRDIRQ